MKVTITVSTTSGAKPGDVVEVTEREGRSLIALGFATEQRTTRKQKKQDPPEETSTGDDDTKKEG